MNYLSYLENWPPTSQSVEIIEENNSLLLKTQKFSPFSESDAPLEDEYYRIDCNDKLGVGGFGYVYAAQRVLPDGSLQENKLYVAKWYRVDRVDVKTQDAFPGKPKVLYQSKYLPLEAEIQNYYLETKQVVDVPVRHEDTDVLEKVLICERLPGHALQQDNGHTFYPIYHPSLSTLTKLERLEAIWQFIEAIHFTHQPSRFTPETIHCDVKPLNTLLYVSNDEPGKRKIGIYLIDYGASRSLQAFSHKDTEQLSVRMPSSFAANPYYYSPEALRNPPLLCKATDIYMAVGVISLLLGTVNPNSSRMHYDEVSELPPFNISGLQRSDWTLGRDINLYPLIERFLQQMQAYNPGSRPNSETCLHFFLSLCKIFLLKANHGFLYREAEINAHLAKLVLIDRKQWSIEIGMKEIPRYQGGFFSKMRSTPMFVKDLAFTCDPLLVELVLAQDVSTVNLSLLQDPDRVCLCYSLACYGLLTQERLKQIRHSSNVAAYLQNYLHELSPMVLKTLLIHSLQRGGEVIHFEVLKTLFQTHPSCKEWLLEKMDLMQKLLTQVSKEAYSQLFSEGDRVSLINLAIFQSFGIINHNARFIRITARGYLKTHHQQLLDIRNAVERILSTPKWYVPTVFRTSRPNGEELEFYQHILSLVGDLDTSPAPVQLSRREAWI